MAAPGAFTCPLCGNSEVESGSNFSRTISVDCSRCGNFALTFEFLGALDDHRVIELLPFLSAATRQSHESGERLLLKTSNWLSHAEAHASVPLSDKVDKLLRVLADRCGGPGGTTRLRPELEYPLISARSPRELEAYLRYLETTGLIDREGTLSDGTDCSLTIPGWQRLEPIRKIGGEPGTCFVAMWFAPELAEIYELGIVPAIEQDCGMRAVRIDRVEHNNQITDEIMAGIRDAQFMVADFTGHRAGVYYEAGFARGLGRDVIYCCRQDAFNERHFDTSVINHIVWNCPADLRSKLANRIKATILPKA